MFEGVHVLANIGAGVAPWNLQRCIVESGPRVNASPVVFFHFSDFKWLNDNRIILGGNYMLESSSVATIYDPYIRELQAQALNILQIDRSVAQFRKKVVEKDEDVRAPKTLIFRAFIE